MDLKVGVRQQKEAMWLEGRGWKFLFGFLCFLEVTHNDTIFNNDFIYT